MNKNVISPDEAASLLRKLMAESIPVVAFLAASDGSECKLTGFVDGLSDGVLSVTAKPKEFSSFIQVPLNTESGFVYGDKREVPEDTRESMAEKYGECVLVIGLPQGGHLSLSFNL